MPALISMHIQWDFMQQSSIRASDPRIAIVASARPPHLHDLGGVSCDSPLLLRVQCWQCVPQQAPHHAQHLRRRPGACTWAAACPQPARQLRHGQCAGRAAWSSDPLPPPALAARLLAALRMSSFHVEVVRGRATMACSISSCAPSSCRGDQP